MPLDPPRVSRTLDAKTRVRGSESDVRFLHTADWHLGRLFHGVHLTEDQAHVLDQLVALARDAKVDAVLLAGDVFDRSLPPADAVSLLDDVLSRLVLDVRVPVVLIAGNHDSPPRLEFASRVLREKGLHICGEIPRAGGVGQRSVVLHDAPGPVRIHSIPYAEPPVVRERLGEDAVGDHETAMRALVGRARRAAEGTASERAVVVAHAFVVGGRESESERPLTVGGAGTVAASCFAGFDFVALGHLHLPQDVSGEGGGATTLHYSGSLLKYSFAEAEHTKSVSLVELDERGACRIERIALTPRRDVRRLVGFLREILAGPAAGECPDDYLMITLRDRGAILDALGKLRAVYPNVLHIERETPELPAGAEARAARLEAGDADLFGAFFREVTGEELTNEERQCFVETADALRAREREAAP